MHFLTPVTEDDFAKIEEKRHTIGRGLRLTYCTDINTLIIKVPTPALERVTRAFTFDFNYRMTNMGLSELDDLVDMGATAYKGRVNQDFRVSTTQPPSLVLFRFNASGRN